MFFVASGIWLELPMKEIAVLVALIASYELLHQLSRWLLFPDPAKLGPSVGV